MRGIDDGDLLPLQRLYRWEKERPNLPFLTQPFGGGRVRSWTWAQAAGEIRRIAGHLSRQDWPPRSQVAILSKNSAWWVMADLAIWMAGHVTVPVYPSLRPATIRQIIEHSDSRACFLGPVEESDAASAGIPPGVIPIRFPNAPGSAGTDWETLVRENPAIPGNPISEPDDLATIFYTSGTTGAPKGVMHRFQGFGCLARALVERLGLAADQRVLSYLPLAHILERGGLELPAILLGWQIFFTEGQQTFAADLQRARVTMFYAVPRVLLKLQQKVFEKVPKEKLDRLRRLPVVGRIVRRRVLHGLGLEHVRFAFCGGAPLPPELLGWYRDLGLNLMEGYGLTEAMITHLPPPGQVRPGYVGSPLNGVAQERAANGELLLKGPMNTVGYYKDPQSTHDALTGDGVFRTGDVVEIDTDSQVKIIGRLKEQFKTSKGKYVAPAPIETRLLAHPDLESCCLMGAGLPNPFAVVVLTSDARLRSADPASLEPLEASLSRHMEQVNAELESHERLAFLVVVEGPWTIANGLMTPTFKFKRTSIEQMYSPFLDRWRNQGRRIVWDDASWKAKHAGDGAAVA